LKWTRHLHRDLAEGGGSYSYPSLIEAQDGTLHATYSFVPPDSQAKRDSAGRALRESIRHVQFTREWVRAGDP
jgi:hypothetical protein